MEDDWYRLGKLTGYVTRNPIQFLVELILIGGVGAVSLGLLAYGSLELCWEAIVWLQTGALPRVTTADGLSFIGLGVPRTGWLGLQGIFDSIGRAPVAFPSIVAGMLAYWIATAIWDTAQQERAALEIEKRDRKRREANSALKASGAEYQAYLENRDEETIARHQELAAIAQRQRGNREAA